MTPFDVAIVGAGFSGTMTAVHLARLSRGQRRIALIGRGGAAGPGVAYGMTDRQHLLNVRAAHMGAFPDCIEDFFEWLQQHPDITEDAGMASPKPESFVPRLVYGTYLRDILRRTREDYLGIETIEADVSDLVPVAAGYELRTVQETLARAATVVLALGNFPPGSSTGLGPYDPATYTKLAEPGDAFLIGTGLTSLDMLATMARTKPKGRVHILSRNGLFPQVHADVRRYPRYVDEHDLPKTALALLAAIRREVRKAAGDRIGWQSVMDALRPLNPALWQALPLPEQKKFLRRLRPYWDTHRHRCAPEIMAAKAKFEAEDRLIQHRGAFLSMQDHPGGVSVTWQPQGQREPETTIVACAVDCTGPQADIRKLDDPLIRALQARDLTAPDPLFLGMDTAADGSLKTRGGEIVPNLYTIGTWRKGRLYESVAVPELRTQARDLAETIAARMSA